MEPTAVIYARVSDRKQAENEVSVPAQIDAGQRKAHDLGATVLRVFSDEGRSAFKDGNRPQFEAAIDFATTVGVTHFITWSSSRFARNQLEAVLFKRQLDRAGVALVYVSASIDRATDEGWMLDSMLGLFDEMSSRQNAKDTKRSMIRVAQEGYFCGGHAPFGFRSAPCPVNPKRKRLQVEPVEAETVREIFEERGRGIGAFLIASRFNAEGRRARGRTWTKRAVLEILRSDAVIGLTVFNRRDSRTGQLRPRADWVSVKSHEALVPQPLWDRVQSLMNEAAEVSQSGSPKSTHPFTGLLKCSCGSGMVTETGKGKGGKVYHYYRCRRARLGEPCPAPQRIRADKMDAWLSDVILQRVLTPANLQEIADQIAAEASRWTVERGRRRQALASRSADLRQRNSRLYDLLELHGRDAPNLADLTGRLRENSAELKTLEAEMQELAATPSTPAAPPIDVEQIAAFMRGALKGGQNAARAREFYRQFIDSIEIADHSVLITYDPARLAVAAPGGVRSRVNWRPEGAMLRTRRLAVAMPTGWAIAA